MSKTSLSQIEIIALKRKNPTKILKRLQMLRRLSMDTKSAHSSDSPLDDTGNDAINLLVQQLKANIFKADLLIDIKEDANLGNDIQKLLAKLNK